MTAQRTALDGGRWHFQHGPIDIVIGADGDAGRGARARTKPRGSASRTVLDELVAELPLLRQPVRRRLPAAGPDRAAHVAGLRARSRAGFITPMAAVAGAVAQELIACYQRPGIERAWINNGGDIALHLAPGQLGARRPVRRSRALRPRATAARSRPTASSRSRAEHAGARHRHQRLARPQLLARHRRQRDGARAPPRPRPTPPRR